jgi:hypothetical protein
MWEMSCYRFDIRLDLNIHGALFILAMLSVSAADGLCWNLELASVGTGGWFQWESAAKFTASARLCHHIVFPSWRLTSSAIGCRKSAGSGPTTLNPVPLLAQVKPRVFP